MMSELQKLLFVHWIGVKFLGNRSRLNQAIQRLQDGGTVYFRSLLFLNSIIKEMLNSEGDGDPISVFPPFVCLILKQTKCRFYVHYGYFPCGVSTMSCFKILTGEWWYYSGSPWSGFTICYCSVLFLCSLMQQPEQEQDGLNVCQSPCDNLSSGHTGMISV